MKKKFIIISSLVACITLFYVEQLLAVNYFVKTLVKIVLFTVLPYIYIRYIEKTSVRESLNLKRLHRRDLKIGVVFGIASFLIVLITYYFLNDLIDVEGIVYELENKSNITPRNFIIIGLYITFGNSFLEEFFFRGFIFLNLYKLKGRTTAYVYSSLLFALYHIAIFMTWFNIWLIGLALFGLVIIGFIFNWLNTKSNNFFNSWIVHIFADVSIILIGLRMFKLI